MHLRVAALLSIVFEALPRGAENRCICVYHFHDALKFFYASRYGIGEVDEGVGGYCERGGVANQDRRGMRTTERVALMRYEAVLAECPQ